MANNYTLGSALYKFPEGRKDEVENLVKDFERRAEEGEEGFCPFAWEVLDEGLLLRHDESMNPDYIADLVVELQDALKDDEPFVLSFAHTCSRARPGEFGGGACLVRRGKDTRWVCSDNEIRKILEADEPDTD